MILTKLGERQAETIELLQEHGESTVYTLEEHGDLDARKYQYAASRLEKRDIVESRWNPTNPKQKLYRLTEDYR